MKRLGLWILLVVVLVGAACSSDNKSGLPKDVAKHFENFEENLIHAEGPWRVALSGVDFGVTWKLHVASGKGGGTCISVETTPDLGGVAVEQGLNGSAANGLESERPVHRGLSANCVNVGDPTTASFDDDTLGPEALVIADIDSKTQDGVGPHYAVLVVNDAAEDVTVLFNDGSTMPVTPTEGLAFVIWNDARVLDHVELVQPGFEPPQLKCTGADGDTSLRTIAGWSCYNA